MHKRCELERKRVSELLEIAKRMNIKGRHDMRKSELIDAITSSDTHETQKGQYVSKVQYIDNAKVGTIIAFRVSDRKVLSGKIEEIHSAGFVVSTKNGVRFTVRKKNVVWVKTGSRWPKGVYMELKGEGRIGEYKAAN